MFAARLLDFEHLDYAEALDLMRALAAAKGQGPWPEILLVCEHEPVVTLGRRATDKDILAAPDRLEAEGLRVFRVERGGLATYHGPGQVVVYPVFDLRRLGLGVAAFVRGLEEVLLMTLADFGLAASRREGQPGIWIGPDKIASLGVAVRRWITFHGLALNYDPNLAHFDLISPCGLARGRMTSLARVLGRPVDPRRLRAALVKHFTRLFSLDLTPWSLEAARAALPKREPAHAQAALA